jgi:hypothetical protein
METGLASEAAERGRWAGERPQPPPPWERLDDQIRWYSRRSAQSRRWYIRLKVVQIVAAAVIPVAAGADAPALATGALGGLIVVLEGVQQLFQFHSNWTNYRATSETLKHEKFLYLGGAGPYAQAADPDVLLIERVEGLVSQEHASWVSAQSEAGRQQPSKG